MENNPQESLGNTLNTMATRTLGVHPSLSLDYNNDEKLSFQGVPIAGDLHSRWGEPTREGVWTLKWWLESLMWKMFHTLDLPPTQDASHK